MKRIFTLAAVGAFAASAMNIQAQTVTVNGELTAAEVSSTGYTLVGRDAGPRGFAPSATNDAGLIAFYAAADANNLYFFLVGTLQNDGSPTKKISNSLQLLIARPGVAGVPVGMALPKPANVPSPGVNTSFEKFGAKLDLPGDLGIGIKGTNNAAEFQVDGVVYSGGATPAATAAVLSGSAGVAADGTVATISGQTGDLAVFNGAKVSYRTAANLNSNPGYGTAGSGAVPAYGLEISVSRTSIALAAAGGSLKIFALQNNADGGYVSSDFIPEATSGNLATDPDFTKLPGTQAATLTVGSATGVTVLAKRNEVATSLRFNVYPNPGSAVAVEYTVPQGKQTVALTVFDATGKKIRSLSETQAGLQSYKLSGLKAGIYVVNLNVAGQQTSSRVLIE